MSKHIEELIQMRKDGLTGDEIAEHPHPQLVANLLDYIIRLEEKNEDAKSDPNVESGAVRPV